MVKIGDYEFSDTVKKGDVITQTPKAGEIVDKYSAVSVVISNGPEHPEIDLTTLGLDSLTAEAAKSLLEGKGFVVNVQNQSSDTVESGKIISYSPDKAKEGAVISVIASTGPALTNPVTVPDITVKERDSQTMYVEGALTYSDQVVINSNKIISEGDRVRIEN